jgi:hypothetical protein
MIDWDKKLLAKLKGFKMVPELYTRFKDDINIVIESLEKGTRLLEEEIVVDKVRNWKMKTRVTQKLQWKSFSK